MALKSKPKAKRAITKVKKQTAKPKAKILKSKTGVKAVKPQAKKIKTAKTLRPKATATKSTVKKPVARQQKIVKKETTTKKSLPSVVALSVVPSEPRTRAKAPHTAATPPKTRFLKSDLAHFKNELLAMRDRIINQAGSMRNAALQRTDETNTEEDGTDAFMRLQTLEQVSSQQQLVTNINESLRALVDGTYGVCETCGQLINKERLSFLPFVKNCILCQSEMERQKNKSGRK